MENDNEKVNIDNIDIQDILEFMETGDIQKASPEIVRYLTLLDKIHGMHLRIRQFGTPKQIYLHLEITEGLSQYKASQMYNEMRFYFYRDEGVSKAVYRNIYAEKLDNLATMATIASENTSDYLRTARIIMHARMMRQLDVPEPPQLPKELFDKPIKVYAMDTEFLGEPKINRLELANQIDNLPEHSASEKLALRQDAAIDQIILFPSNEQEDHRKSK